MEMERINDHTIRVMMENEDLQDRGTSVRDLLNDRDKIESFFYSILSEVDTNHDFVDDDKVSFQILPNQDGLELFISRLDGQNQISDVLESIAKSNQDQDSIEIDEVSDQRRATLQARDSSEGMRYSEDRPVKVYSFANVDELINLSHSVANVTVSNGLYRYQGQVYLIVDYTSLDLSDSYFIMLMALIEEFATTAEVSDDVLIEHGEVIYEDNALSRLAKIFD